MIQDVIDLRNRRWMPRRREREDQECEDRDREWMNPQFQGNMGPMVCMSRDGRMGDRRGDDRNRKQSRMLPHFILSSFQGFLNQIDTIFVYVRLLS